VLGETVIKTRISFCLFLLLTILVSVGHAQTSADSGAAASPEGSVPATAKSNPSTPGRVILKVGDAQITQADFEAGIDDFEGEKQDPTEKDRRKLGDDYASVLMLSQRALAEHLDSTPELSRQLMIDRLQTLSNAEFDHLKRQAEPTAEEVRQYYATHLSDYDEISIRRLFIWKRHEATKSGPGLNPQDARARADAILQASASAGDANALADAFKGSKDALLDTAPSTFPRGELPAHMEKAAFAMKQNEWSQVEDTPDRILLIQLVERKREPLEEVSSLIKQRLQEEKLQVAIDEMKKNAAIWMDEKYFGTAAAPKSETQQRSSHSQSEAGKMVTGKEEKPNGDVR